MRILIVAIGLILVGVILSAFTVTEAEYALKRQFGKIVKTDFEPGLHWRVPVYNTILKFDRRIQSLDAEPERFLTSEKKDVIVDSFVKWKIEDVARFYTSTSGDMELARLRLSRIIQDGLRAEFAKRTLQEVVSGERSDIMQTLRVTANQVAAGLGITIVDVRIKRINLPDEVSSSVFSRMQAERARVANELRSQGREQAEAIEADADRQRQVIVAQAQREAEITRGEGDAQAAAVYANAYERDPEFYRFYRSLGAYRAAFERGDDVMVLSPDSSFFQYFESAQSEQ